MPMDAVHPLALEAEYREWQKRHPWKSGLAVERLALGTAFAAAAAAVGAVLLTGAIYMTGDCETKGGLCEPKEIVSEHDIGKGLDRYIFFPEIFSSQPEP